MSEAGDGCQPGSAPRARSAFSRWVGRTLRPFRESLPAEPKYREGIVTVTRMPRRKAPDTLRETVDAALEDMDWLNESDAAAAGLAKAQASAIDDAEDRNYAVAKVGPQLLATLVELGGTPGSRKALGVEAKVKGKLAQLREGRGRAS